MPSFVIDIALIVFGGIASGAMPKGLGEMFRGFAEIIRERYRGKALLIRAERGDPPVMD